MLSSAIHSHGKRLVQRCHDFKNANTDISELVLRVEHCCLKTEDQLRVLITVKDLLDESLLTHQDKLIDVLEAKLSQADRDLARVTSREKHGSDMQENRNIKSKKIKFVVALKECLEKTVIDLEGWSNRFDPSWWLILRLRNPAIDRKLSLGSSHETKTAKSLATLKNLRSELSMQEKDQGSPFEFIKDNEVLEEIENISGSEAETAYLISSGSYVIIDTIKCDAVIDPLIVMKDVKDLARILANVDHSRFGLLHCEGAIKHQRQNENPTAYSLLFKVPSDVSDAQSLRDYLDGTPLETPLNERIDLAVTLARAVLFLHASHFVHKNIRPENVIILRSNRATSCNPYLVGFEKFRLDTTSTHRYGDDLWEKNLYRHPKRQGIRPQEDFIMQHDVYSLGVVLLELGMNISFVNIPEGTDERPTPAVQLEISDNMVARKSAFGRANTIKERLVSLAETRLPNTFGRKYSEVVLSCLMCLDKDNQRFGDKTQFEDQDGILVGVQYIDKVCTVSQALSKRCV